MPIEIPTETVVNEAGAKQSRTVYRMDLIQARAVLEVAKVMEEGSKKYGENNWHKIPTKDHINHALIHLLAYLIGDEQEPHLPHAAWRVLAALEVELMKW